MTSDLRYFVIRKLSRLLIHAILTTCRKKEHLPESVRQLPNHQPLIFLFWHRHIFYIIYRFRNTGARPLISLSRDGELVARVAREFGFQPIRGSSSRGGTSAFLRLMRTLRRDPGSRILITADGPKGPPGKIKEGVILLSQKTRVPIIPLFWECTHPLELKKTWDRFLVPLPFSTITLRYGEPVTIPPDLPRNRLSDFKKELEGRIGGRKTGEGE